MFSANVVLIFLSNALVMLRCFDPQYFIHYVSQTSPWMEPMPTLLYERNSPGASAHEHWLDDELFSIPRCFSRYLESLITLWVIHIQMWKKYELIYGADLAKIGHIHLIDCNKLTVVNMEKKAAIRKWWIVLQQAKQFPDKYGKRATQCIQIGVVLKKW